MNLRLHDKCNRSINRLIFLALFCILLYHLLAHVRMAKIVINFTPIVKDFSPKLRKKTNFSEKADKYTTRKSKCYQMVLFLNEAIGLHVLNIFCVDMSNLFVSTKMADEFHAEALRRLCCERLIFHTMPQLEQSSLQPSTDLHHRRLLQTTSYNHLLLHLLISRKGKPKQQQARNPP